MPQAPEAEFTQAIEYNQFTNSHYNVDFKGPGLLRIDPAGPTYSFSGKRRRFFGGQAGEMKFDPEDIENVEVIGRIVRFKTSLGKSGHKKVPFVFHLPDQRTAESVAELMPQTKDVAHHESQDFTAKLDEVAGPADGGIAVTKVILGLNVLVFIIMGTLGAGWLQTADMMPYILYGANNGAATTDGEWWRLLTSMFMHFGVLHLALNMWALYQAGHFLERILGRSLYALTYLGAGLVGGFASVLWYGDQVWSAGASGAVFGVFGGLLGYVVRQKQAIPKSVYQSMLRSSLSFAAYNILFGMTRSGIDNAAHVGGLAGGFVFAWLVALPLDREIRARAWGRRLKIGFAALIVTVSVGIAITPRFNYRVSEVIAWTEVSQEFAPREQQLQTQQLELLGRLAEKNESAELVEWVESQAVPFYEERGSAMEDFQLESGKQTSIAQVGLLKIFDLKLGNYRQLVLDLRAGNPAARERYETAEENVITELNSLRQTLN